MSDESDKLVEQDILSLSLLRADDLPNNWQTAAAIAQKVAWHLGIDRHEDLDPRVFLVVVQGRLLYLVGCGHVKCRHITESLDSPISYKTVNVLDELAGIAE